MIGCSQLNSFSKHFITAGVSAIDGLFFGKGTMVEVFRQGGTVDQDRDWLRILVKTPASWSAQSFSTRPETPSGPAAFRDANDELPPTAPKLVLQFVMCWMPDDTCLLLLLSRWSLIFFLQSNLASQMPLFRLVRTVLQRALSISFSSLWTFLVIQGFWLGVGLGTELRFF